VTRSLRVENNAARELQAATHWYEERLSGLGVRFLEAVNQSLGHIENFPKSGKKVPGIFADLLV
jgi:hypothetical protein